MSCNGCSGGCAPEGCGDKGQCATGGCNKLNVHDWFSNVGAPSLELSYKIVEVRFKNNRKEFYRNVNSLNLITGDYVAVEAQKGHDVGVISMSGELVRLQLLKKGIKDHSELRKIYRKASELDIKKLKEVRKIESAIRLKSREIISELKLDMKLGDVEYQGDQSKITFFYTAEGRVDFRELIRLLASEFRVRVEMRQIGARQEAAMMGGIGSCGRELCCSTWLTTFKSVSTSAARYQNLSVNPAKLAGQCGRLKCCLNFELQTYLDAISEFPKNANKLKTAKGMADLLKTDVFKREMVYSVPGERFHMSVNVPLKRVKEILRLNREGKTVETLLEMTEISAAANVKVATDGEGELSRFDHSKPKRKKKRKKNNRSGAKKKRNDQK